LHLSVLVLASPPILGGIEGGPRVGKISAPSGIILKARAPTGAPSPRVEYTRGRRSARFLVIGEVRNGERRGQAQQERPGGEAWCHRDAHPAHLSDLQRAGGREPAARRDAGHWGQAGANPGVPSQLLQAGGLAGRSGASGAFGPLAKLSTAPILRV